MGSKFFGTKITGVNYLFIDRVLNFIDIKKEFKYLDFIIQIFLKYILTL